MKEVSSFGVISDHCFGCGRKNRSGLQLQFRCEDGKSLADFKSTPHHQGWKGVMHGGVIAAIHDEAMAYSTYFNGLRTITARIKLRYLKAVPINQRLRVIGEIEKVNKRLVHTRSRLQLPDGTVVSEASAVMYVVKA